MAERDRPRAPARAEAPKTDPAAKPGTAGPTTGPTAKPGAVLAAEPCAAKPGTGLAGTGARVDAAGSTGAEAGARVGRLERLIAAQVRRLRQSAGLTLAEMAVRSGISKPMLSKIENAHTSCSLTTLARLADALDVPVTALFRGADEQREAVYTPAGAGARIVARGTRVGHDYTLLGGLRGPHKRMEAHLVTLTDRSETFPLFQHAGTELLYMLDGEMVYGHGDASYTLRPGDALQLDGEGSHGPQELLALPIRFLSVVAYGSVGGPADSTDQVP